MNNITIGDFRCNLDHVVTVLQDENTIDVCYGVQAVEGYENSLAWKRLYFDEAKAFLWYWDKTGSDVMALYREHLKAEWNRTHLPSEAETRAMLDGTWEE